MPKVKLKPKTYNIVTEAVFSGITLGMARAHKHVEHPSHQLIIDEIENNVMLALCEVIDFD